MSQTFMETDFWRFSTQNIFEQKHLKLNFIAEIKKPSRDLSNEPSFVKNDEDGGTFEACWIDRVYYRVSILRWGRSRFWSRTEEIDDTH